MQYEPIYPHFHSHFFHWLKTFAITKDLPTPSLDMLDLKSNDSIYMPVIALASSTFKTRTQQSWFDGGIK